MPVDYSFETIWKLNAPLEQVWQAINSPGEWPQWWKGVEAVEDLKEGDALGVGGIKRFTWKSRLPYRLSFNSRVVTVEPMKRIEGVASGDLDGRGIWTFAKQNGTTTVKYDWMVRTNKPWMNLLAPIARPVFEWNHDVIMQWGAEGLAKRLNCDLVG